MNKLYITTGTFKSVLTLVLFGLTFILMPWPLAAAEAEPNASLLEHADSVVYSCPMHPDEISQKPGRCSQCGMFLVEQATGDGHSHEMPMAQMSQQQDAGEPLYVCPMHPDEVSDEPGKCAKCGMFLVEQHRDEAHAEASSMAEMSHRHAVAETRYVCPMHPDEVSDAPGKCSQCGMFLVEQSHSDAGREHSTHDHAASMTDGMGGQNMPMARPGKPALFWDNPHGSSPQTTPPSPGSHRHDHSVAPRMKPTASAPASSAIEMPEESPAHAASHRDPTYVCPMHPQIVSADPDASCPICGMDLVTKNRPLEQADQATTTSYICPMHPQIVQHEPGGSCPICGMDLVARESAAPAGDHPQVYLSPAVVQNMGVRTTQVQRRTLGKTLKTQGIVNADDDRMLYIHPRAAGWVEKLYLISEGDRLERKDEIMDFYSPWINQIQLEFIQALEEYDYVAFDPTKKTELQAKLDALRNSLRSLNIPPMDMMHIEKGRKVLNTIELMAPQGGLVTELNVREGSYVEPYQSMLTIVDLSVVWVMVDIYEHQAPWVRKGQEVVITAPAIPGRRWNGRLDFIYPEVDPKTRTLRARIRVPNPDEALLLNMFVQVELSSRATHHEVLSVPREAVIITGERELIVTYQGEGHFQPVEVTTGIWSGEYVEVLSGLSEGDEVVVSGQFLIDSESSLQASFLRMME